MEKLVVLKIDGDNMLVCGFFDSKEQAVEYLTAVKNMIDSEMQHHLAGEYIAIPALYYHLQQTTPKTK
jgi:hypothetical protein